MIANILSEFIEDDIIRIDLNEFEQRFINSHLPIDSTVRILCKDCHRVYDKVIKEEIPINPPESNIAEDEESDFIEKIIKNKMNRSKAIALVRSTNLASLLNSNAIFSNISSAYDFWWLQPHNDKFQKELYFILNDEKSKALYVFKLPANTIRNPEYHFNQRNDKFRTHCSDIYIPVSGTKFADKKGFDFTEFLLKKLEY